MTGKIYEVHCEKRTSFDRLTVPLPPPSASSSPRGVPSSPIRKDVLLARGLTPVTGGLPSPLALLFLSELVDRARERERFEAREEDRLLEDEATDSLSSRTLSKIPILGGTMMDIFASSCCLRAIFNVSSTKVRYWRCSLKSSAIFRISAANFVTCKHIFNKVVQCFDEANKHVGL